MAIENERIRIDPAALSGAGRALTATGARLADDASRLGSAGIDASAFGLMNAWLVPPIVGLAAESVQTIEASGRVAAAIGTAATASAEDFATTEQHIIDEVGRLEEGLQ